MSDDDWYAKQRIALQDLLDVEPDSEAAIVLQLDCAAAVAALANLPEDVMGDVEAIGAFYEYDDNLWFGAFYPRLVATTSLGKAIEADVDLGSAPEFDVSHIQDFFDESDNRTTVWSIAVEVLDTPVEDLDFFFDQFTKSIVDPSIQKACAITSLAALIEYRLLSHPDSDIYDGTAIAKTAEFFDGIREIGAGSANSAEIRSAFQDYLDSAFFDQPVRELTYSILRQLGDESVHELVTDERIAVLARSVLPWWAGNVVSEVNEKYADAFEL